jgi:hypothetical protein
MTSRLNTTLEFTSIKGTHNKTGSSALYLDLRNSTKVVRTISSSKLGKYTRFMLQLQDLFFSSLLRNDNDPTFALNDTGDGLIAVFWDKTHAWSALSIAASLHPYLTDELATLNSELKLPQDLELKFGIGLHSGGCKIYRCQELNRFFMYGVVLNTSARLESFTKQFSTVRILLSEYFVKVLNRQYKTKFSQGTFDQWKNEALKQVTTERAMISDAKDAGHILYTIKNMEYIGSSLGSTAHNKRSHVRSVLTGNSTTKPKRDL